MRRNAQIYVMRSTSGALKVGHSRRVKSRRAELGKPQIVYLTDVLEQAEVIERMAHRLLKMSGRHIRGEWFSASLDEIIAAIERAERIAIGAELPPEPQERSQLNIRLDRDLEDAIEALRESAGYPTPTKTDVIRQAVMDACDRLKGGKR
jgi:hypothetical protein